ncbi:hypothetical protein PMIN02_003241 [Paraphaeosphaeria minitans]
MYSSHSTRRYTDSILLVQLKRSEKAYDYCKQGGELSRKLVPLPTTRPAERSRNMLSSHKMRSRSSPRRSHLRGASSSRSASQLQQLYSIKRTSFRYLFPVLKGCQEFLTVHVLSVWGGGSSVGSCAIQMANASGAEIFTTASRRNFDYVKSLGATKVFDYHDDDVEDQIVDALKTKTLAGVYHAAGADGAVQTCARIADQSTGRALVVTVKGVPDAGIPCAVRVKAITSSSIFKDGNHIGPCIWRKYLPAALARGTLVPKPDPLIVGNGLRSVQLGLDKQKAGVSAKKVVVNQIDEDSSHELEMELLAPASSQKS